MKILMILMLGSGRKETTKMDPILMRRIWKRINTDFGITRRTHIGDEHPSDFETKKRLSKSTVCRFYIPTVLCFIYVVKFACNYLFITKMLDQTGLV